MGALSIRNMNWTMGLRESHWDEVLSSEVLSSIERRCKTEANVEFIFSQLSIGEYQAWLDTTPDDNVHFYEATVQKVNELRSANS